MNLINQGCDTLRDKGTSAQALLLVAVKVADSARAPAGFRAAQGLFGLFSRRMRSVIIVA